MSTPYTNVNLVIADDHEIFRDGLKLMLSKAEGITLVGEASNGADLVNMVKRLKPDVVLTDIKMPIMDGVEATRQIVAQFPEIGVIGLSMFEEEQLIMEMLDAGALGYLLKNSDKTELVEAIHAVSKGHEYYCKHTSGKLAKMIAHGRKNKAMPKEELPVFSDKEMEIIKLICQGLTTKEISEKVFIGARTLEGVRARIQEKMHAKNTVGIVIAAIKLGIFEPE